MVSSNQNGSIGKRYKKSQPCHLMVGFFTSKEAAHRKPFLKAFDIISIKILTNKLGKYGTHLTTVIQVDNWLENHTQSN